MTEAREVYLEVLNLRGSTKKQARKAALERAHEIRQFEIELFWKRANYFWLLQAAVFAAVGLTWRSGSSLPAIVPIALSGLGVLTAQAGWLATHGSKFWQSNWEHHIDMLETEFEGSLYKTVYITNSGVRWSLSGVSQGLAFCFVVFWMFLLVATSFDANPHWNLSVGNLAIPGHTELVTIILDIATVAGMIHLSKKKGGIKGSLTSYPPTFSPGDPYSAARAGKDAMRVLMRREPKIK